MIAPLSYLSKIWGALHTPPHPPDQTSSSKLKPTMQIRICGIFLSRTPFLIETQSGADWTEPGFGTRAYMDCMISHSEGGAGDDEMVPCSPPWGANGGREKGASPLDSKDFVDGKTFLIFPPIVPQRGTVGDLSSRACRGSTHGSYGVLREAKRGAHPPDQTSSSQPRLIIKSKQR